MLISVEQVPVWKRNLVRFFLTLSIMGFSILCRDAYAYVGAFTGAWLESCDKFFTGCIYSIIWQVLSVARCWRTSSLALCTWKWSTATCRGRTWWRTGLSSWSASSGALPSSSSFSWRSSKEKTSDLPTTPNSLSYSLNGALFILLDVEYILVSFLFSHVKRLCA